MPFFQTKRAMPIIDELKEGSSCSSGSTPTLTPSLQLTTNTAILRASCDEERLKQGLAVSQFALPGASASWIIRLLNAPLDDLVVYPRRYLAASHEVFSYMRKPNNRSPHRSLHS